MPVAEESPDASAKTPEAPGPALVSSGSTVPLVASLGREDRQLLLSSPAVLISQQTPSHLSRAEITDFFSRFGPLQGQGEGGGGGLQFPNDRRDKRLLILFARLSDAAKCLRALQRDGSSPGKVCGEEGLRGTAVGGEGAGGLFGGDLRSHRGSAAERGGYLETATSGETLRWPHPVQLSREDKIKASALKGNPRALQLLHSEGILGRLKKEKREEALRAAAVDADAGKKKAGLFDEKARADDGDTRRQHLAVRRSRGVSPSPPTSSQTVGQPLNDSHRKSASTSRGEGAARLEQPAPMKGVPETYRGRDRCRLPPQKNIHPVNASDNASHTSSSAPGAIFVSRMGASASTGVHRPVPVGGAFGASPADGGSTEDNSFLDLLSGALVAERLEEENAELFGGGSGDGEKSRGGTQDNMQARTRREAENALLR